MASCVRVGSHHPSEHRHYKPLRSSRFSSPVRSPALQAAAFVSVRVTRPNNGTTSRCVRLGSRHPSEHRHYKPLRSSRFSSPVRTPALQAAAFVSVRVTRPNNGTTSRCVRLGSRHPSEHRHDKPLRSSRFASPVRTPALQAAAFVSVRITRPNTGTTSRCVRLGLRHPSEHRHYKPLRSSRFAFRVTRPNTGTTSRCVRLGSRHPSEHRHYKPLRSSRFASPVRTPALQAAAFVSVRITRPNTGTTSRCVRLGSRFASPVRTPALQAAAFVSVRVASLFHQARQPAPPGSPSLLHPSRVRPHGGPFGSRARCQPPHVMCHLARPRHQAHPACFTPPSSAKLAHYHSTPPGSPACLTSPSTPLVSLH